MGAASSVQDNIDQRVAAELAGNTYEDVANTTSDAAQRAHGVADEIQDRGASAAATVEGAINEVDFDAHVQQVASAVDDAHQEAVIGLMGSVRGQVNTEQMARFSTEIKDSIPNLHGDAILAGISGGLQAATEMAPEVMASLGAALLATGEHLPYIAVAAGAIGAIVYTFNLSKDQDDNTRKVTLWMISVKDWLMLIAWRVDRSGAASTIPLFAGLQETLLQLTALIDHRSKKWRITKMLSSVSFERDFTRVKTNVLELKNALRDFLDQESQDKQEKQLEKVADLAIETNEKLDSIEDQLAQIRGMLESSAKQQQDQLQQLEKAKAAAAAAVDEAENAKAAHEAQARLEQEMRSRDPRSVKPEEEEIFANIQRAAGIHPADNQNGVNPPVPFSLFALVIEAFFFSGKDLPVEQRRGLKIAVDRHNSRSVSKAAWIKFYRQWTASGLNLEIFLNQIAEEHPALLVRTFAEEALNNAKARLGVETMDDAKKLVAEKTAEMKARAEDVRKNLYSGAKNLFANAKGKQKQNQ